MKKRILSLCLLILMILGLTSCQTGNQGGEGTSGNPENTVSSDLGNSSTVENESSNLNSDIGDITEPWGNAYLSSIERAEELRGKVNVAYEEGRTVISLSNQNAVIRYPLTGDLEGSKISSPEGQIYLSSLPEVYIKNRSGKTFPLTDTGIRERLNIYRLGSYYYEVHLLDGGVAYEILQSEAIDLSQFKSGNDIGSITATKDSVRYTVTDTYDPYLNGGALSIDASIYTALEIKLTATHATTGQVYLAAGAYSGITGAQMVNFSIEPDGTEHTYLVPLDSVPDYSGTLKQIRFDIGGKVGEEIVISSVKAVQLAKDAPAVKLDRTFHVYSDKINDVIRLVAEKSVTDLAAVGTVSRIAKDRVEKLVIKDKNGLHTSLDGVDFDSAEYVGFDIRDAGIYGLILLPDKTSGKLAVSLEGEEYVLRREYAKQFFLSKGNSVLSGSRIYTDENHGFEAFLRTAEIERNPLSSVRATTTADQSRYIGYDVYRGAYRFDVAGHSFQKAYENPDRRFLIGTRFEGADIDYPIYIYSKTTSGNLESGALLTDDNRMLPIALEVMKNFTGENEEPFYDKGDNSYGEILFPMVIEAGKKVEFSIVNLYQNWGKFPLKQISSIQFTAPYYHLSTGSTETNCIAPYYVIGKDHWLLPDFRAMSAPLWESQPQHASIGRLYFLQYKTADGKEHGAESVKNIVNSYGPTYSDIDMRYLSDDGKIEVSYRHLEYPQWDENRTYYTVELTVKDRIEIKDFKTDFSFFSFDGRNIFFKQLGYLNEQNECVTVPSSTAGTARYLTLGSQSPYVSYFDGNETADLTSYVNFGLLVKDAEILLGGKKVEHNFMIREQKSGDLNHLALTMDLGEVVLEAGDRFVLNLILLPWGDPSSENDENVRTVREDSCLKPYKATASVGTVTEDCYLPRIESENGYAEFTLSGGKEASAVRVYGFEDYRGIVVEELIDGNWVEYQLSSDRYDYDGYTVYYDGDGSYSYAFLVKMEGKARTFRVKPAK